MKLTGAEIIIECLKEQGVDTVFGFPGGAILDLYDALYKHPEIRHYLTSHEQGAAHAADGYARATGRVGVCFATSGPGATNLVTGIATAYMDSIPVVAVTCNVTLPLLGKDSFQEVDIAGISMPITKHGTIVKDISVLADTIRRAFAIARNGRPGPVLVDVTKNVVQAVWEYEPIVPGTTPVQTSLYSKEELKQAADMIMKSRKPLLYVGGGAVASGAYRQVRKLAALIDAPVCDTLLGKGVVDGNDPSYAGMIGMHGTKAANFGASECDLLIALGARFDDRVIGNAALFAPAAKILHMDIDRAEVNKNIHADLALVGDLKKTLEQLIPMLSARKHPTWQKKISSYKKKYPLAPPAGSAFTAPDVIRRIQAACDKNMILVTDVGQHQMWAAQYYVFHEPRTFLTSGGLGTMGYGLGAAIGASCAFPDRQVVNITGDGCFRMNLQELATASRYNIPVIDVIINNHTLGMVRQWQTLFYGGRYSQTTLEDKVDFCKTAEGLGCRAYRVTNVSELDEALRRAFEAKEPAVIECVVAQDDKVYPMVAPGASLTETFDEKDKTAE